MLREQAGNRGGEQESTRMMGQGVHRSDCDRVNKSYKDMSNGKSMMKSAMNIKRGRGIGNCSVSQ